MSTRDWSFSSVIFESESTISALSEEYLFSWSIRLDFNMRMSLAFESMSSCRILVFSCSDLHF